ncbi:MAG: RNA polymerase sigma factor [Candidatus Kuenenbacteria bacterium]
MVEKTDEEIAQAVQNGNSESFGLLVERYEQKLLRYAKKFLFGYTDAEDLVQEVFIKSYINIQSFNTNRRFSPWLYRIAHNEFINAIKKKGKEPVPFWDPDTLFPHPVAAEITDREVIEKDLKKILDSCLDKLEQKYREPLVLFYFEEMDYQTIGDVLKIPVATVGVRLHRARLVLRKIYNQIYE